VLRDWLAEVERGDTPTPVVVLRDCIDPAGRDMARQGRTPKHVDRTRRLLELHAGPLLGRPVGSIRHRDIEQLLETMAEAGLSPATQRHLHAAMSGVLRWAQREDLVAGNAARIARKPSLVTERHDPPTAGQVALFVAAGDRVAPAVGMLIRLAAVTGCRRGELAALRWSDVDWERHTLSVARAVTELAGGGWVEGPTKNRHRRVISIDIGTVGLLRGWRAEQVSIAEVCEVELLADGFVLAAQDHEVDGSVPWLPERMSHGFRSARRQVPGCGHIRLHDLRHAHATLLLAAGESLLTVAGRLGHDPAVTARTYSHFLERTDRGAADLIGVLVHGPGNRAEIPEDIPGGVTVG
jgi:integrase